MADFVAVIRRTVDGLSDNVPEMRAKVYDKARGAVRRQLESMKPRPSDEMIERQMVKLEAAIGEVEDDHAEALPPLDEQPADAVPKRPRWRSMLLRRPWWRRMSPKPKPRKRNPQNLQSNRKQLLKR
jgi:hypothetical protein